EAQVERLALCVCPVLSYVLFDYPHFGTIPFLSCLGSARIVGFSSCPSSCRSTVLGPCIRSSAIMIADLRPWLLTSFQDEPGRPRTLSVVLALLRNRSLLL